MTADTRAVTVDALDAALATATGSLAEDEQRLAVAVFRLLSAGRPATVTAAAAAAGIPEPAAAFCHYVRHFTGPATVPGSSSGTGSTSSPPRHRPRAAAAREWAGSRAGAPGRLEHDAEEECCLSSSSGSRGGSTTGRSRRGPARSTRACGSGPGPRDLAVEAAPRSAVAQEFACPKRWSTSFRA